MSTPNIALAPPSTHRDSHLSGGSQGPPLSPNSPNPNSPNAPSSHSPQLGHGTAHTRFESDQSRASRNSATLGPNLGQVFGAVGPHSQSAIGIVPLEGGGVGQGVGQGQGQPQHGSPHPYTYPPFPGFNVDPSKGGYAHPEGESWYTGPGAGAGGVGGYVPAGAAWAGGGKKSPIFVGSLVFGILATLLTLIAQSILSHNQGDSFVGFLWFGIIVQIIIITWLSFSTFRSPSSHHLPPHQRHSYPPYPYPYPSSVGGGENAPIAHLATIVVVIASLAIDRHIHPSSSPVQHATAAGWLLVLLVDFFWILYFSSPPWSGVVRLVDGYGEAEALAVPGTGKPGRGEGGGGERQYSIHPFPSTSAVGVNGAPTQPAQPQEGYLAHPHPEPTSPLLPPNALALRNSNPSASASQRDSSAITGMSIDGTRRTSGALSEGRSIDTHGVERTPGAAGIGAGGGGGVGGGSEVGTGTPGSGTLAQGTPAPGYTSRIEEEDEAPPTEGGGRQSQEGAGGGGRGRVVSGRGDEKRRDVGELKKTTGDGEERKVWKARALYTYKANSNDPSELSFNQGELLDILDKSGRWWSARKVDGGVGIAPSNYLQLL